MKKFEMVKQKQRTRDETPLRARQTSRNKTLCYLQGEEAPVFCSRL